MATRLTVYSEDGSVIAFFCQKDGAITFYCKERVRGDVTRFVQHGLDEYVGRGVDAEPRHTPPSDPLFLPRLEDYLKRQFQFVTKLEENMP